MSLVKSFANAVRIKAGARPLIVTTSEAMATVTSDSPLLNLFTKRDTSMTERLPAKFVATATEGLRKPELQLWDVDVNIDNSRFVENVRNGLTYDAMLDFMKARELSVAKEAGFAGTDSEIIAQRKQVVAANNVFRFVK
jgi:hypothetical protein